MALNLKTPPPNEARGERVIQVGPFEVLLGGEHDELARLDAAFDGIGGIFVAMQRTYRLQCGAEELIQILRVLGWPKDAAPPAADLIAAVKEDGLIALSKQLGDYLFLCLNGGRELADEDEDAPAGEAPAAESRPATLSAAS